jgi:hypothetical protein
MTIDDLSHIDLAYAPPFGSARDVINTAGFAAGNAAMGMLRQTTTLGPQSPDGPAPLVVDVRDAFTSSLHPVPDEAHGGADASRVMSVPMEMLRKVCDGQ